jgi:hypothetical protein
MTSVPAPVFQREEDAYSRQTGRLLCLGGERGHRDPGAGRANEHASIDCNRVE